MQLLSVFISRTQSEVCYILHSSIDAAQVDNYPDQQ